MEQQNEVPRSLLTVVNRLYELERQSLDIGNVPEPLQRGIRRVREAVEEYGLTWEDPQGWPFNETRTDLDASISGESTKDLVVVDVIKPIIRKRLPDGPTGTSRIVQPGVVIVKSSTESSRQ